VKCVNNRLSICEGVDFLAVFVLAVHVGMKLRKGSEGGRRRPAFGSLWVGPETVVVGMERYIR
jgi:hypothetical protein